MTAETASPLLANLVCPDCRSALHVVADSIQCSACCHTYEFENGFPNLIVGGRFDDEPNEERTQYEEECNLYTAENYFVPLFKRMFARANRPPRILSLGCGTGVDVDTLSAAGFDVTGIDCGSRCSSWLARVQRDRLLLANGKRLPFATGSFDAVYCGCVFPHVGTVGDSHVVKPDYSVQRGELAREMSRILRPGGHIVVSSPNRACPVDLFHGRTQDNPLPRINRPSDSFLLSFRDYRSLFEASACRDCELLPVTGYWGFVRRRNSIAGRLSALPIDSVFKLLSTHTFAGLRSTPLSPWIVVHGRKS